MEVDVYPAPLTISAKSEPFRNNFKFKFASFVCFDNPAWSTITKTLLEVLDKVIVAVNPVSA